MPYIFLPTSLVSPDATSHEQLTSENQALREQVEQLSQQLDWFKRQLFGEKSEKRLNIDPQVQPDLLAQTVPDLPIPLAEETVTYTRRKKQRSSTDVNDKGLRFDDTVPLTVIEIRPDLPEGTSQADYEVIGSKSTFRLCQNPGSHQIIEYRQVVMKRKGRTEQVELLQAAPPPAVLERCHADVSLLAGLLVDKFLYHLPLNRQHQRLKDAGITLSRSTLMNWARRSIELLEPIYDAQYQHILRSRVLAMDETPIKAGRKSKGKMKRGYFWPMYGEADEVVFPFSTGRGKAHLEKHLEDWQGDTLLSDGYVVYARYLEGKEWMTHAECWAHTRRKFEEAKSAEPVASAEALSLIGALYQQERIIRERELQGKEKLAYRIAHSRPAFEAFWRWCEAHLNPATVPSAVLGKALKYAMARREPLQVFLADPDVAIDTNHLERSLRPIPMGRRSWLFCWSELGAKQVGIIQSLIVTCRLHGVHPYTYLVDVLQRVSAHPARAVIDLTPRVWKTQFADNPLKSDLDRYVYNGSE